MFQFWVVSLAFGVATFTVACGRQQAHIDKTAQATVDADVAQSGAFSLTMPEIEDAAVAARVKEFHVLVSGKKFSREVKVPYTPKESVSIPAIPAGEVSVRVRLMGASAEVLEEGEGKASIEAGKTSSAQISLKPVGDATGSLVIEICRADVCLQPKMIDVCHRAEEASRELACLQVIRPTICSFEKYSVEYSSCRAYGLFLQHLCDEGVKKLNKDDFSAIRCNPIRSVEPPLPPADPNKSEFEEQLRKYSLQKGIIDDSEQLRLLSSEKVTWNDGCMGIETAQLCTMALVDGYRFVALNHKSRTTMRVVFHTDRDLRVILVASELPEVTIPEIQ